MIQLIVKEDKIFNKVTGESIPLEFTEYSKKIVDIEEFLHPSCMRSAYYMVEFSYDTIEDSDDTKLYNALTKEFLLVSSKEDKNEKKIIYHIILHSDDIDMKEYIEEFVFVPNKINSFEVIKVDSNKLYHND